MLSVEREDRRPFRSAWGIAPGLVAFALSWCTGAAQLRYRHPHEDAFILYRYVENLASGRGMVFNPGGPRVEGATDFLYAALLALLVRVKLDVAVAAILLNALGSGCIAILLSRMWTVSSSRIVDRLFPLLAAAAVPFVGGALASYSGFGTQSYCALVLCAYYTFVHSEPRTLSLLPWIALIIALFRPDGVIVAGAFVVVTFYELRNAPAFRASMLRHAGGAILVAASYFVWRYWYFGELLPLPLYVKSQGATQLPGLATDRAWLHDLAGPLPPILAIGIAASALGKQTLRALRRALIGTLPVWFLLMSLVFARQTQNVDWRFQAPVYTILVAAMVTSFSEVVKRNPSISVRASAFGVLLLALLPALKEGRQEFPRDYVDTFAVLVGKRLGTAVIVLTEAGRIPYWTTATVYDMVGLNSPRTAHAPPTVEYVRSLHPDILFYHIAGTLDTRVLVAVSPEGSDGIARIEPKLLREAVRKPLRRFLSAAYSEYPADTPATRIAPVVLSAYLAETNDFDVFAVRYGDNLNHILAVRRGRSFTQPVEEALYLARRGPYVSYAEAKEL